MDGGDKRRVTGDDRPDGGSVDRRAEFKRELAERNRERRRAARAAGLDQRIAEATNNGYVDCHVELNQALRRGEIAAENMNKSFAELHRAKGPAEPAKTAEATNRWKARDQLRRLFRRDNTDSQGR